MMAVDHKGDDLTPQQEEEAKRLKEKVMAAVEQEVEQMARLMASKEDHQLFGQTEFELRDIVHRIGAKTLEISANDRVKKGLSG